MLALISMTRKRFLAIDLETANHRPDSAFALGIAVTCDGKMVETREWRFRPASPWFGAVHRRLHSIPQREVLRYAPFPDAWPVILTYLEDAPIVAHNAHFDMRVLQHTLLTHRLTLPTLSYNCSWLIARRTWSTYRRFGLAHLAHRLSLPINHHDACADATLTAAIVLAACQRWGVESLSDLEERTSIQRGLLSPFLHQRPVYLAKGD